VASKKARKISALLLGPCISSIACRRYLSSPVVQGSRLPEGMPRKATWPGGLLLRRHHLPLKAGPRAAAWPILLAYPSPRARSLSALCVPPRQLAWPAIHRSITCAGRSAIQRSLCLSRTSAVLLLRPSCPPLRRCGSLRDFLSEALNLFPLFRWCDRFPLRSRSFCTQTRIPGHDGVCDWLAVSRSFR